MSVPSRVDIAAVLLAFADKKLHYDYDLSYIAEVIRNDGNPKTPWLTMNTRLKEKAGDDKLFLCVNDGSGHFDLNSGGQDKHEFVISKIGQNKYDEICSLLRENKFLDAENKLVWTPHRQYIHNASINFESSVTEIADDEKKEKIKKLLLASKQIIMTGAPGTGKTYTAMKIAEELITANGGTMDENYCKVQFHSGYDYSDFIIGLKPKVVNGQVVFKWQDGVFKKFADRAKYELDKPYIFVIDEINRADLSRVFGEVFSLLEAEYRKDGITLPNGAKFTLPDNLYIIGTMNDIDRSVESMDFALRRRFSWIEVTAEESDIIIKNKISDTEIQDKLISVMRTLNEYIGGKDIDGINLNLGDEYKLGGAYFVNYLKYDDEPYTMLWENHIAVILNEYLRGSRKRKEIISALYSEYKKVLGI